MFDENNIIISPTKTKSNSLAWSLLIILSLIWGSSFILIKKALIAFTPMQVGTGRIVIAFIAFLPLFFYHYKNINWSQIKPLIVVGLCGSGLPALLYATGQSQLPSAVAGVLNSLTPICTLLISMLFFTQRFDINKLVGVFIGLIGVCIIFFIKEDNSSAFPFLYAGLILLATICYGISANTVSHYLSKMRPILISTLSFVLIGPFALVYLLSTDIIHIISHTEGAIWSLGALMTLSIVCTFLANILFFKLIQITEPVFSSTVSYLIPFVALSWGFLDGEYISIYHILALGLILSGIVVVKYAKPKK
jgi:drug/metabolite transporter (DMT)-like permease